MDFSKMQDFVLNFFNDIINQSFDFRLYFGGVADVVRSVFDIFIIAFAVYHVLVLIRRTRTWQLFKGLIFLCIFIFICKVSKLQTVNFFIDKISVVATITLAIVFQPELRRFLETVGINIFKRFTNLTVDSKDVKVVKEICDACDKMAASYTGALILIERSTMLNEFLSQENVVRMDSDISSSVLQSIFYKGAPMHDGGILIRNNRIIAARCHVPLATIVHQLERSGTRHRAAVGASEIGDLIAVVVSEERGKTSIAINGKLFEMESKEELQEKLLSLLNLKQDESETKLSTIFDRISKFINRKKMFKGKTAITLDNNGSDENVENKSVVATTGDLNTDINNQEVASDVIAVEIPNATDKEMPKSFISKNRAYYRKYGLEFSVDCMFILLSVLFSVGLWLYVRCLNNPLSKNVIFAVPVVYNNIDKEMGNKLICMTDKVDVTVKGQKSVVESLTEDDIIVQINVDDINVNTDEIQSVGLIVTPKSDDKYFKCDDNGVMPNKALVYFGDKTK